MLASHSIQLYKKALQYSNDEAAAFALTCEVEALIDNTLSEKNNALATKENMGSIRSEITNLHIKIAETKANTIKCMFVFVIGQIGATLAIILLFLKK